ncbi:MAG: arylsulfatase [Symploca sp. SIO3E6]|nr:arylsulfatase [Caldora sp. SIO3E6]
MSLLLFLSGIIPIFPTSAAFAQSSLPNILVIMGDDIGLTNVSAYGEGIVGYETPNIDRIANEGIRFTDYYGEQSCTAGRGAFITGQSGLRTGLLKVGFPGATFGIQDDDPTLAEMLKPLGYTTGQFGKNHLGDLNPFLPTLHGFDEFYGNLYHLNAEEEPENVDYPSDELEIFGEDGNQSYRKAYGPRGVLHCYAGDQPGLFDPEDVVNDPEMVDRFEEWGNQTCVDTGPLNIERMKTIDDDVTNRTKEFISNAVAEDKPFFTWFNSTRMHIYTHLKEESKGVTGQDFYGDGMVEHDGHVGELLDLVDDLGISDNTIIIYTTDNGPHYNQWPDGAISPFRSEKNTNWEGAYRIPTLVRWPGHFNEGVVSHEIFSHLDWVPTLMAAVGIPDLKEFLADDCPEYRDMRGLPVSNLCGVHLDGYNQLDYLTNVTKDNSTYLAKQDSTYLKGPRNLFIYFNDEGQLPGVRYEDWKIVYLEQRAHKFDVWREEFDELRIPKIFHLRRDPYERADTDSSNYDDWWVRRAYLIQPITSVVQDFMKTFKKYPPSQPPFSASISPLTDITNLLSRIHSAVGD